MNPWQEHLEAIAKAHDKDELPMEAIYIRRGLPYVVDAATFSAVLATACWWSSDMIAAECKKVRE